MGLHVTDGSIGVTTYTHQTFALKVVGATGDFLTDPNPAHPPDERGRYNIRQRS